MLQGRAIVPKSFINMINFKKTAHVSNKVFFLSAQNDKTVTNHVRAHQNQTLYSHLPVKI